MNGCLKLQIITPRDAESDGYGRKGIDTGNFAKGAANRCGFAVGL